MKNKIYLLFLIFPLAFSIKGIGQNAPTWVKHINALPDSAKVSPVRVALDHHNNILVLSNYRDSSNEQKIYLKKYDFSGALDWTLIYDKNGSAQARGVDMAIDKNGNTYITGGFMQLPNNIPLLLKVSPIGDVLWLLDSTNAFKTGIFNQIIIKNNLIYLNGNGLAAFDLNGNEKWSNTLPAHQFAVDEKGQLIASGWDTLNNSVFRFDSMGVLNFSDSSLYYAEEIATDLNNNFYLLNGSNQYELVKYDSSGIFQWSKKKFPPTPPFGDIGLDLLVDLDSNIIVIGTADSMYKFSPSGSLIWKKSMNGLDNYLISSQIFASNQLAIAGTKYIGNEYSMAVAAFNLNGDQNWSASYNANVGKQEFMVEMSMDNSDIYIIGDNIGNTSLVKFDIPSFSPLEDYSLICVDSIWYNSQRSNSICIRIFNGSVGNINYPSVQLVSPTGDTIGNPENQVTFFSHFANNYKTYCDSISVTGITDFSNYGFLMGIGYKDTIVQINSCSDIVGLDEYSRSRQNDVLIYPNPFSDAFTIHFEENIKEKMLFKLYDISGRQLMQEQVISGQQINRVNLKNGFYLFTIENKNGVFKTGKLIAK